MNYLLGLRLRLVLAARAFPALPGVPIPRVGLGVGRRAGGLAGGRDAARCTAWAE